MKRRRYSKWRVFSPDELQSIRDSSESVSALALKHRTSHAAIGRIRKGWGRFTESSTACPVCKAPATKEPYGHRCPHGEPCRATARPTGEVCRQCEPITTREVHA